MSDPSLDTNKTLSAALKKVLSSLVRLVVRFGITYPEFLELLKRVYVQEVQRDLEQKKEKVTISRISVVSGVHRKDVKRFVEEPDLDTIPEKASLTARLVSLWLGDSRFVDDDGEPKALRKQGDSSFEELVSSISKDIRARTIIDEWLERGLIKAVKDGYVLQQEALYPSDDLSTKLSFFARNTSNHIAACEYNLQHSDHTYPERSVYYNQLSQASVDQLQEYISKESHQLLVKVNKKAQAFAEVDDAQGGGQHRFILGAYFYREQEQPHD